MKKKPEVSTPTLAELQQKLAYETQRANTYRQQRDSTTSQFLDYEAKVGAEISRLTQELQEAQAKIAELEKPKA